MEDVKDLSIECAKIAKDLIIALYQVEDSCFAKTDIDKSIETINKTFNAIYKNIWDQV